MMPSQREVEVPLLHALQSLGGKAPAQEVYKAVTKLFPQLSEADLSERLSSGGNKWTNRIQFARSSLVTKGELTSAGHGVWAVTEKGLARLKGSDPLPAPHVDQVSEVEFPLPSTNLEEIDEGYRLSFKQKALDKLQDLSPSQFEQFGGFLLKGYGFQKIEVTGKTGDGGIDGHGELEVGLATIKAAFQCKRWQQAVPPKEVQAFRGSFQGKAEQGYFFTTSTFTKAAQEESRRIGAAPVVLFDGGKIVDLMIERRIGVRGRPVEVYEDEIDQLFGPQNTIVGL